MTRNPDGRPVPEQPAKPAAPASTPLRIWSDSVEDALGDLVTLDAYDDGDVTITISEQGTAQAVFSRDGRRHFDRKWHEVSRAADGTIPAGQPAMRLGCPADLSPALGPPPDIHTWFGLSYANHLVLPRTLLQSMPDDWQRRLTTLLEEMSTAFAGVPQAQAYKVDAAEVHEVGCLDAAQLAAAGIAVQESETGDRSYTGPDGHEMEPLERVLITVPDPVPHYDRGRTRVALAGCQPPHAADHRCFGCAPDEELATAIPPFGTGPGQGPSQ